MSVPSGIRYTVKAFLFTLLALILLAAGAITALYTPWFQEMLRIRVTEYVNSQEGQHLELKKLRLKFPLSLALEGLCYTQQGDTVIAAGELTTEVRLLPLLKGKADISGARLRQGRYTVGTADSALYMKIGAGEMTLKQSTVELAHMNIDISDALLQHGYVDLTINPDTVPTPPTPPTEMTINLHRATLKDFTYRMHMLPYIDSLGTHMAEARLMEGRIDMLHQTLALKRFDADSLTAAYIAADSAQIASTPVTPTDSLTPPWTIRINTIHVENSQALYTTKGWTPQPGLDFSYIQAHGLTLDVRDFYNCGPDLTLPLAISGTERCGVELTADGTFAITDSLMTFTRFRINTPSSALRADGYLGTGELLTDNTVPVGLTADGELSTSDMMLMFPYMDSVLKGLPAGKALSLDVALKGNPGLLELQRVNLGLNGMVTLYMDGHLEQIFTPELLSGHVNIDGDISNGNGLKTAFMGPPAPGGMKVNVPPLKLRGGIDFAPDYYAGKLTARTHQGVLALDGSFDGKAENYSADIKMDAFPIQAFLPEMGVGAITGSLNASGHGLDFLSPATRAKADIDIKSAVYDGYTYRNISGRADLLDGRANLDLESHDPAANARLTAAGNLSGKTYDWTASLISDGLDLYALHMAQEPTTVTVNLSGNTSLTPGEKKYSGHLILNSLNMTSETSETAIRNAELDLDATDSLTQIWLKNGDLRGEFRAPRDLMGVIDAFSASSVYLDSVIALKRIDVKELQRTLPPFNLDISGGNNNAIADMLAASQGGFKQLSLKASNDTVINLNSRLTGLYTASMRLDTIDFSTQQRGEYLVLKGRVNNRPGTFDEWAHVKLDAYVTSDHAGMEMIQQNIKGQTGFDVGARIDVTDSLATLRLIPLTPLIAYHPWTVNEDNFISYAFADHHIDANIRMKGQGSTAAIFTQHDPNNHEQEELRIQLGEIRIQDWISINPFAPPMRGELNTDLSLTYVNGDLNVTGAVGLDNFYYNRERVGDVAADVNFTTRADGALIANTDISINGVKTMSLTGRLNDQNQDSPFNLNFSMIKVPLSTVNPFLPPGTARLRGVLNGSMDISGDSANPVINGWLDFDSTAVKLNLTGTEYAFSEDSIPVINNVVTINHFPISGVNENPLYIDGTVDLKEMSNMKMDLSFKAQNMQLVNTNRAARGADVYGKAFINLDASVKGNTSFMRAKATLDLLPTTNVTYVMSDAATALQSQATGDMVKFVNFTDSVAMAKADSLTQQTMALLLEARLNIIEGSVINVDLSTDGKNKVRLESSANLTFTSTPVTDMRLTGQLNILGGYVRYTPPLMSEFNFQFADGSYVAFNGDMMNPRLNIHASDQIKANVTQEGQNSRLVNFDVGLSVTGTLEQMDVAFDLSTNDDITVANELQSMSPEQRASQAMNMLLYRTYTGPGTRGSSINGNPLYSFLESQLNTWAANTIKGVDLSFGIDQYDRTRNGSSQQTTSYSYQVSKSLFNDRFKIVVGGNYSTDEDPDTSLANSLINDISLEYFLNARKSMYVRLFRHTGFESILEGEITQTGVGFVYRKKIQHLSDMFRLRRKKRQDSEADSESETDHKVTSPEKTDE
ncbi:MAG: translocation/assembly module TamB [Muribaculaceae bacterium]|nr:translocation/assembly module TamB [Muribaculaceae bacterium]